MADMVAGIASAFAAHHGNQQGRHVTEGAALFIKSGYKPQMDLHPVARSPWRPRPSSVVAFLIRFALCCPGCPPQYSAVLPGLEPNC
jgi:hypothetical protein